MQIHIKSASGVFHFDTGDSPNGIANLLRSLREEKHLSVREVASRMGYRSKTSYLEYELGHRVPSLRVLEKLILALEPTAKITLRITA